MEDKDETRYKSVLLILKPATVGERNSDRHSWKSGKIRQKRIECVGKWAHFVYAEHFIVVGQRGWAFSQKFSEFLQTLNCLTDF